MDKATLYQSADDFVSLVNEQEPEVRAEIAKEILYAFEGVKNSGQIQASLLILPEQENRKFGAEVFKTRQFDRLPLIVRDGMRPPWMDAKGLNLPGDRLVEPELQRTGSTCFTLDDWKDAFGQISKKIRHTVALSKSKGIARSKIIASNEELIANAEAIIQDAASEPHTSEHSEPASIQGTYGDKLREALESYQVEITSETLLERQFLEALRTHAEGPLFFEDQIHTYFNTDFKRIIGEKLKVKIPEDVIFQGLGDLSMNEWNVGYFKLPAPMVFAPQGEPLSDRRYTCLAFAPDDATASCGLSGGLHIDEFTFSRTTPHATRTDDQRDKDDLDLQFAVYGKAVVWDGRALEPAENIDEWTDVRHVFKLANINPEDNQMGDKSDLHEEFKASWSGEIDHQIEAWLKRPRLLFGKLTSNDIWLFERELRKDPNLRRLACVGPIQMPVENLPTPRVWIDWCLKLSGYIEVQSGQLSQGQYRWEEGLSEKLHIFLDRNTYPVSMVGIGDLGPRGRALYCLAVGGNTYKHSENTIWDYAKMLASMGCERVLAFDEGQDVFQTYLPDSAIGATKTNRFGNPEFDRVTRKRNRLRACLSLWRADQKM